VQIANFGFVPLEYRTLVTQSFSVVFNTYLAWKTNVQDSGKKPKNPEERQRLGLDDFARAGV
jgi:hypothetical protein